MSIEDIKYQIQSSISEIESAIEELRDFEDMEEAVALWSEIEGEFGDPDTVLSELRELQDIRQVFESLGHVVDGSSEVEDAIAELVAEASSEGSDEILTAVKLLVSALTSAGVLPGTETVPTSESTEEPAVADNAVIAAPTFTNLQNI
jgi:chaperonin cofactor prefoldin